MRKLLTDFLQSRPPPHCPPPDPCGLPPSPPPSLIPTNPLALARSSLPDRDTISHSINLFAIPRPIPFRRRAGVFHGVRGGCCCWVVCCVWAGAGGRGGVGPTVPAPPPPCVWRLWRGAARGGGVRPRRRARRVAAPIVYSPYFLVLGTHDQPQRRTNPAAQTTQSQPACTPQPKHHNAFAGGSTIAHHGIETLRV